MKRFRRKSLPALILALILVFSAFPGVGSACFADDTTPHDWYFKKVGKNERPPLDAGLKLVEKYDCLYLAPEKAGKTIYLTFDAGYENGNVEKILNALEAEGAIGNFFILENLVRRAPELVLRMEREGHTLCNHTARHPDMSKITDPALFARQLTALEKVYTELTGKELAKFYRPPQGRFSERNLKDAQDLGYTTVFWSYAYADWDNARQPDEKRAIDDLLAHTHPGMILLLHPTSATNAAILPELLRAWKAQGYRFGSLSELR